MSRAGSNPAPPTKWVHRIASWHAFNPRAGFALGGKFRCEHRQGKIKRWNKCGPTEKVPICEISAVG